jgi:hypothetical protein
MLIKNTTFTTPEIVLQVVRNVSATTAVPGDACQYNVTATSKGLDVHAPVANQLTNYAGIWTETVARSNLGKIQVYGYSDTIKMGLSSAAIGDMMKLIATKSYITPIWIGASLPGQTADYDGEEGFVVSWTVTSLADSLGTTGPYNGFIRAL